MRAVLNKILLRIPMKLIALALFIIIGISSYAQQATTYDEAIKYGDKNLASSNLMDAKAYFQQALKLAPGDEYAKTKISEIVLQMKSAMAAEDEYYDIIDLADELYDSNKLTEAVYQYNKALAIIPNDEYAKTKVREIVEFQNSEAEQIEAFDKAMEAGNVFLEDEEFDKAIASFRDAAGIFPDKDLPVNELNRANKLKSDHDQKADIFNTKVDEAERYFMIKNYSEALKLYKDADEFLPENDVTASKINLLIPLAAKQSKFNRQIEKADEYYITKDFISARKEYLSANELWPEKSYPGDMISKIDDKLEGEKKNLENNYKNYITSGDSLFDLSEYSLALGKYNLALNLKPNETYPESKISRIESIFSDRRKAAEANYSALIVSADSAFNSGQYNIARDKYETALEVNPDDIYPANQLDEIEKVFEKLAAEEEANKEYNNLIQQADNLYTTGNYDLAIKKYREAQALKSIENYPQDKIDAITAFLANAAKQKQIDDKYNELILIAVKEFNNDKLNEARILYVNAAELKPGEQMPLQQVEVIDSLITLRENKAIIKKQFDDLLVEGDSFKENKEYDLAINKYDDALALIPNEKTAKDKKQSVITIQTNIRKEAERKKSYEQAIEKGDNLFDVGSFELARVEFEKAQSIRTDQEYPRQRLSDIRNELKRLEAEKEERYTQSVADADVYYDQGNYEEALKKYQLAISIKPGQKHPQQRISECSGYVAEKMKRLMAEYEVAIANADKFYSSKIYDKAIAAYRNAENIKPDESYPSEMINKISKYIEENSIVDIISTSDTIITKTLDKYTFEPVKINVRKSNYIIMKARSLDGEACKLIVSYGSGTSKNGGFVIQVTEGTNFNDYLVRVGNQYKWFSEDNDWITIYPENGDVEVSMLRVAKGY